MNPLTIFVCIVALLAQGSEAFISNGSKMFISHNGATSSIRSTSLRKSTSVIIANNPISKSLLPYPRRNAVKMGLFGLGAPEIAVIIVVAALVLGPDKLTSMAKDAGKMAGELKEVPREFQAGISEGEAEMKKIMKESKKAEAQDAETSE